MQSSRATVSKGFLGTCRAPVEIAARTMLPVMQRHNLSDVMARPILSYGVRFRSRMIRHRPRYRRRCFAQERRLRAGKTGNELAS
jgi:hypothetical protein